MFYLIVLYKAPYRMKFTLVVLMVFSFISIQAQQDHFIYFQTENRQQFYVKFDDKVYNSSPPGYLVISKLKDTTYKFILGFSQNSPEKEFTCVINNKDFGFIIKNTEDQGLQLFNLLSMNGIVPDNVIAMATNTVYHEMINDPFSVMLANVVHDSTILQKESKPVVAENTVVTDSLQRDSLQNKIPANTLAINTAVKKKVNKKIPAPVHKTNKNVALKHPVQKPGSLKPDSLKTDSSKIVALNNTNNQQIESKPNDSSLVAINDSHQPKDTTRPSTEITVINQPQQKTNKNVDSASQQTTSKVETDSLQTALNEPPESKKKLKKKKNAGDTASLKEIVRDVPNEIPSDSMVNAEEVVLRSVIKRRQKKNTDEGIEFVYTDKYGDDIDTVRILLPLEKAKRKKEVVMNDNPPDQKDSVQQGKVITDEEKKIIEEVKNQPPEEKKPDLKSNMINSDCKNFATDDDFLKLRKKIVLENNDEDMIKVSKKVFKTKCFTTEQVKNLSVLFLTDQGKYMFFDAAYPFVSDSDLYYTLESQLTDSYYITRFRAMIKH